MIIIDPHIHTKFSPCGFIGLKELFITAIDSNLDAIIITDHNILSFQVLNHFPQEYKELLKVFIGEEISTKKGDILAYGIEYPIPKGLSPEKTIKLIHNQGGIAVAAHPYRRAGKVSHYEMIGLGDEIFNLDLDAIEGINGGNQTEYNKVAIKSSKILDLPAIGGSDAHIIADIGSIVMEMPDFNTMNEFIKLIIDKKFKIRYRRR